MIKISGTISVKYSILYNKRKVLKVFFKKNKFSKDFNYIKYLCHDKGIDFEICDDSFFEEYKNSGGILAYVNERNYDQIDDLKDVVLLVQGIEDPYNIGYILRNCAAYGASVILCNKDISNMEDIIMKSSAGALDFVEVVKADELNSLIACLKKKGYFFIALYRSDNSFDFNKIEKRKKVVICLGGEKRGLSKDVLELCDQNCFLAYDSEFKNALNASSAAAISLALYRSKK